MRIGGPNLSLQGRVFFFTAVAMTLAQAVDANVSHQLQEVLAVPVALAAHLLWSASAWRGSNCMQVYRFH